MLTSVSFRTKQIWVGFRNAVILLDHLHHHLGSCDDACRLSHVAAGLQRQKIFNTLFVITMFSAAV